MKKGHPNINQSCHFFTKFFSWKKKKKRKKKIGLYAVSNNDFICLGSRKVEILWEKRELRIDCYWLLFSKIIFIEFGLINVLNRESVTSNHVVGVLDFSFKMICGLLCFSFKLSEWWSAVMSPTQSLSSPSATTHANTHV